MRTTMNLRARMLGQPLSEKFALGDNVKLDGDREGVVKVADGPGETTGVLVDGEMEMVATSKVERAPKEETEERTDEAEDCADDECPQTEEEDEDDDAALNEGVMGMAMMPTLDRMRALAGIRNEAYDFAKSDDEEEGEDDTASEEETETADNADDAVDCETADCEEPENCEDKSDCDEATSADAESITVAVEPADQAEPNPWEKPADPAVAANHPATAGEVTMMSSPVDPEPMPDAEPEQAATPTQACFDALAQIEQHMPNIPVKDFAEVRKRIQNMVNSLMENANGRNRKL